MTHQDRLFTTTTTIIIIIKGDLSGGQFPCSDAPAFDEHDEGEACPEHQGTGTSSDSEALHQSCHHHPKTWQSDRLKACFKVKILAPHWYRRGFDASVMLHPSS